MPRRRAHLLDLDAWSSAGTVLNFAESIETVQANLREVQPTLFFAVPRIWEKLHAGVIIRAKDATWIKRKLSDWGMQAGRARSVTRSSPTTATTPRGRGCSTRSATRSCSDRCASGSACATAAGPAPAPPRSLPRCSKFFIGLGVPVFELYGMTENAAVATLNFAGRMKLGTVGEPYPGIGFRIDEQTGEIQTKHDGVFKGYWNKPEATAETFTEDGWLKTGDVGEWVDGTHVKIVDRIKHIIITSGGKNISPSEIENKLKASPVREGGGRHR